MLGSPRSYTTFRKCKFFRGSCLPDASPRYTNNLKNSVPQYLFITIKFIVRGICSYLLCEGCSTKTHLYFFIFNKAWIAMRIVNGKWKSNGNMFFARAYARARARTHTHTTLTHTRTQHTTHTHTRKARVTTRQIYVGTRSFVSLMWCPYLTSRCYRARSST